MSKRKKDNPEYYKVGYKTLGEWKSPRIDKLKELYAKDRYKARIIYMNDNLDYTDYRIMLFTKKNGDFSIVRFRRTYGISKTNIMYSHEKRLHTVIYTNKKFWLVNNEIGKKYVTHLSLEALYRIHHEHADVIKNSLAERFSWVNYIYDERILYKRSFNTIVTNKIYSLKKALQFQYKMPTPPAKILHKYSKNEGYHTATNLKYYLDYLDKIQALKEEWFKDNNTRSMFHDTLKMAKTLNKKINCSWSTRRLKEEHDNWAKEITDVIYIDGNRDLKVNELFIKFSEMSGFSILTTTKDLAIEGKRNNHCVVTYANKVDSGNCAIYRIGENTLELTRNWIDKNYVLKIGQFRGYGNKSVPKHIVEDITKVLIKFNEEVVGVECSKEFYKLHVSTTNHLIQINDLFDDNDLPF